MRRRVRQDAAVRAARRTRGRVTIPPGQIRRRRARAASLAAGRPPLPPPQSVRALVYSNSMAMSQTEAPGDKGKPREKRGVPSGLWMSCDDCGEMIYRKDSERLFNVCPKCGYHFYLDARGRIASVLDDGTFDEWDAHLEPTDPLEFA